MPTSSSPPAKPSDGVLSYLKGLLEAHPEFDTPDAVVEDSFLDNVLDHLYNIQDTVEALSTIIAAIPAHLTKRFNNCKIKLEKRQQSLRDIRLDFNFVISKVEADRRDKVHVTGRVYKAVSQQIRDRLTTAIDISDDEKKGQSVEHLVGIFNDLPEDAKRLNYNAEVHIRNEILAPFVARARALRLRAKRLNSSSQPAEVQAAFESLSEEKSPAQTTLKTTLKEQIEKIKSSTGDNYAHCPDQLLFPFYDKEVLYRFKILRLLRQHIEKTLKV